MLNEFKDISFWIVNENLTVVVMIYCIRNIYLVVIVVDVIKQDVLINECIGPFENCGHENILLWYCTIEI
jgi:hypothetical protein